MAYANPVRWDNHPDDGEVVDLIGVQFDINKARSVVRRTRTDVYLREIRTAPFWSIADADPSRHPQVH